VEPIANFRSSRFLFFFFWSGVRLVVFQGKFMKFKRQGGFSTYFLSFSPFFVLFVLLVSMKATYFYFLESTSCALSNET